MLMAASWPSNNEAADTNRNGRPGSGGFIVYYRLVSFVTEQ